MGKIERSLTDCDTAFRLTKVGDVGGQGKVAVVVLRVTAQNLRVRNAHEAGASPKWRNVGRRDVRADGRRLLELRVGLPAHDDQEVDEARANLLGLVVHRHFTAGVG